MGRSLVVHLKKDGTVTMDGEAPDKLVISIGEIAKRGAQGHVETHVIYHFASGDVTYKIVDPYMGDPDNPNSPITGYYLEKVSDKTSKRPAAKKAAKKAAPKKASK